MSFGELSGKYWLIKKQEDEICKAAWVKMMRERASCTNQTKHLSEIENPWPYVVTAVVLLVWPILLLVFS